MNNVSLQIGNSILKSKTKSVSGKFTHIEGEPYYKISNFDMMQPFLMSIVSDSDHWMFLASNGGITAGRRDADHALFPYYTDDKIFDSANHTGSKTFVRVEKDGKKYHWEPFSERYHGVYRIERNLYKNRLGNKILFEEINKDLSLTFQYGWMNSEKFGIIKTSRIINHNSVSVSIEILDGVQNLLPYGLTRRFQMEFSTLGDAYKKSELLAEIKLAIYSLSSIPTDKAEPGEALKATTVWSTGLNESRVLLSEQQIGNFCRGFSVEQETELRARRGAYFLCSNFELAGNADKDWLFACEINQDAADVFRLSNFLEQEKNPKQCVLDDVANGCENLGQIIANADGLQFSGQALFSARHFSNVLFNVMRGGIFDNDYSISKNDFISYLKDTNREIVKKYASFLQNLPEKIHHSQLLQQVESISDNDLERLGYDYLPLTFSRRHGDPSRPWNHFAIEIKNENGEKILNYQGNWRDIFQNWEALLVSFPGYIESAISKFLNASTADGYNPYRVTRDGFDWEILDPADPWSYIGYWGDHQVIYLLRLLELSRRYHPNRLESFLTKNIFAFANVPYRIKSYQEMLKDPHSTIDFDTQLHEEIEKRVKSIGSDGRFLWYKDGNIFHVNLTEKLLLSALTRFSNFIPEAGIWMNTQRPEWNDANNALVGFGVSMVTLYYLRRFLSFCKELFQSTVFAHPFKGFEPLKGYVYGGEAEVTTELAAFLSSVSQTLQDHVDSLEGAISNRDRKIILDELGEAGSVYRNQVYSNGFSGKKQSISFEELISFCDIALRHIDFTIKANKRNDKLYHAYNLMKVENDNSISIRRLYEMLEGQVAVLSSGYLSAQESLEVLDALRNSALFREDQHSYILYPNRRLPRFIEKNLIPREEFEKSELLKFLAEKGDWRIVTRDINGNAHFNGTMRNARVLNEAMDALNQSELKVLVEKERDQVLEIYEKIFDHQAFTGRSGTFFKYEGLGSIYWHKVSKLLLAIQENIFHAIEIGEDTTVIARLIDHYRDVQVGIGVTKSPDLYGAFPTDPYSHTPAHTGVQQPGMTGQVKEDILSRFGELGIFVQDGKIHFRPNLLNREEFLSEAASFDYYQIGGGKKTIALAMNSLGFTYCQVPVIYTIANQNEVILWKNNGTTERIFNLVIDEQNSAAIFRRDGIIKRIDVWINLDIIKQL